MPLRRFEEALYAEGVPLGVSYPSLSDLDAVPQSQLRAHAARLGAGARLRAACTCPSPSTPRPRPSGWSTGCCWPIATACCASPRPPRASTSTRPRSWRRCRSAPARDGTARAARLWLGRRHARARRGDLRPHGRRRRQPPARIGRALRGRARHRARHDRLARARERAGRRRRRRLHAQRAARRAVDRRARGRQARALREADGDDASPTPRRCSRPPRVTTGLLLVLHPWRHHRGRDRACATRSPRASSAASCARTATACTPTGAPAGWFTDPALAGGGALVDMGIHAIDTARFLLGEPEPPRVLASITTAHGELRGRRRRHRPDRVGGRRALGRGVGLVAAAPRRPRGRYRGLRQHGLPPHLGARAAARLRALRRRRSSSRSCATRWRRSRPGSPGRRRRAHGLAALRDLRAGLRVRAEYGSTPCRLTARSASPASPAACAAPRSTAACCARRSSRRRRA